MPPRTPGWDARTPILVVLIMSVLVLLVDRPLTLGALAAASLLWAGAAGLTPRQWAGLVAVTLALLWSLVVAQVIFYAGVPRVIWFTIVPPFDVFGLHFGGVHAYAAGVRHGLVQGLRFITLLAAGLTCAATISAGGLLTALARLRVPYVLCFLTATGIRLLPVVLDEWRTVRRARRLRLGGRAASRAGAVRRELAALRPVLGRALRRSATLAAALAARQFDPARARTSAAARSWRVRDTVLCAGLGLALGLALAGRAGLFAADWGLWRPGGLGPAVAAARALLGQ